MQKITNSPTFEIKNWSKDMIALVATERYDPPIKGLPPTKSHVIVLGPEDVDNLLKVITDYANERRNT